MPESKCQGCGKLLQHRTRRHRYCLDCQPVDPRHVRLCTKCHKARAGLNRAVCDACWQPGRNAKQDAKRKAERRARGLRRRLIYVWHGELLCVAEIARKERVKASALYARLRSNPDIQAAVAGARLVS